MIQLHAIGHIGQDAKIKQTDSGYLLTFSLAVNKQTKDVETGNPETVYWINCIFFRNSDKLHPYLIKGTKVFVQGELSVDTYQRAGGEFKSLIECKVMVLEILSPKKAENTPS